MITYKKGNILDADAEVLVNTVNSVGVMGKGIALQFKNNFPDNYKGYKKAVDNGKIRPGYVYFVKVNTTGKVKFIANFATKDHWRHPSRIEWIETGLTKLKEKLFELNINSVALPPLGCGNGGLDWDIVKQLMERKLRDYPGVVFIYEPSKEIRRLLKAESKNRSVKLTPARAMLLSLLYSYRSQGEDVTEFAAEKLSFLLQTIGEKQLKLDFRQGYYGPYSGKVRHVLYALNGDYLKGYEQKETKPFEPLEMIVNKKKEVEAYIERHLSFNEKERLNKVANLIRGFETPYGLELLTSIRYLLVNGVQANPGSIHNALSAWSRRKQELFDADHIELGLRILDERL